MPYNSFTVTMVWRMVLQKIRLAEFLSNFAGLVRNVVSISFARLRKYRTRRKYIRLAVSLSPILPFAIPLIRISRKYLWLPLFSKGRGREGGTHGRNLVIVLFQQLPGGRKGDSTREEGGRGGAGDKSFLLKQPSKRVYYVLNSRHYFL